MSTSEHKQHMRDSDTIFNVVTGAADNLDEAMQMWKLYAMDMTFSRGGVAHVIGRLEKHYGKEQQRGGGE